MAHRAGADDDSDPDFDDLDDVLDQFAANTPAQSKSNVAPPPLSYSASAVPESVQSSSSKDIYVDQHEKPPIAGPKQDESETDFIERLSKEMSTMLNSFAGNPSKSLQSPEEMAKMGKELEEFTYKMEQEGVQPEQLLKALLGQEEGARIADLAQSENHNTLDKSIPQASSSKPTSDTTPSTITTTSPPPSSIPNSSKPQPKSFEDTIRKTMSRLDDSDKSATTATQKSSQKTEEDLLADMLRALESGPGGGGGGIGGGGGGLGGANLSDDDGGISKMFMDMMQQLTHKDLLYEPMKELNDQYPTWLQSHKPPKLSQSEYDRFARQSVIVAEITRKFEEPGFRDEDPKCKDFIWEKMQRMQDEGAPPEDLVKNPLPGTDFGSLSGFGGGGGGGDVGDGGEGLPEGLAKELEEGCPTQ